MKTMASLWSFDHLWHLATTLMVISTFIERFVPEQLRDYIKSCSRKFMSLLFADMEIKFHEFPSGSFGTHSKAYTAIETYLGQYSYEKALKLRGSSMRGYRMPNLSMDYYEEITDEFEGIEVRWALMRTNHQDKEKISYYNREENTRYYQLTFHSKHREIVTKSYLPHVLSEGKAITKRNKIQRLYTNSGGQENDGGWDYVGFEHPATFDTVAMEPRKKQEIMDDLLTFSKSKDYYSKIGKTWKRGYLLYGPPGTGKSTMIAAMANFLHYDIYDLELTAVKSNNDLRRLLMETSKKSIIVIEDIDCSLDLTGQRNKTTTADEDKAEKEKKKKDNPQKVTLSGLLNFIDGLWSACGSERLVVFTTNHVEKLDPALIRRGRMDKHIEMSYCSFEAFKVLAMNYLKLESHHLFSNIHSLLQDAQITPADVAENLMPKSPTEDAEVCLNNLIKAIEKAKEVAILKEEAAAAARLFKAQDEEISTVVDIETSTDENTVDNEEAASSDSDSYGTTTESSTDESTDLERED